MKLVGLGIAVAAAVVFAAPAYADVDTDFTNQLHTYGIYGQKDYNAWIAKITCERLHKGVDANAFDSAAFLAKNLDRGTTTQQIWQFLGAAIPTYCPELTPVLHAAADHNS